VGVNKLRSQVQCEIAAVRTPQSTPGVEAGKVVEEILDSHARVEAHV
jgi:hypothetical protein